MEDENDSAKILFNFHLNSMWAPHIESVIVYVCVQWLSMAMHLFKCHSAIETQNELIHGTHLKEQHFMAFAIVFAMLPNC